MKLGLIVHRFPPAIGGSERFTEVLAENLHAAGHDVTVYTTRHPDRDATTVPYEVMEFANRVPEDFGYFAWPSVFTPRVLRSLRDQDAVHAVGADMFSAVVGAIAKRLFGTTAVLTTFYHPPEQQVHARLKGIYDRLVLQDVLETYDHLHVSSDFEWMQQARNFDLSSCNVARMNIPPTLEAVPTEDFRKERGFEDDFLLLYVGRLDSHKGMSTLLPAIERLTPAIDSLRCIIVGETERWHEWPDDVSSVIEANEDRFVFTGVRTGGDLAAVYDAADVFVFPSSYETYGLVTVEALSYGTPVVATPVGIAPELIDDGVNGFIYEQDDTDALVGCLEEIAAKHRGTMEGAARASVADLSWSTTVSDFVACYSPEQRSS